MVSSLKASTSMHHSCLDKTYTWRIFLGPCACPAPKGRGVRKPNKRALLDSGPATSARVTFVRPPAVQRAPPRHAAAGGYLPRPLFPHASVGLLRDHVLPPPIDVGVCEVWGLLGSITWRKDPRAHTQLPTPRCRGPFPSNPRHLNAPRRFGVRRRGQRRPGCRAWWLDPISERLQTAS